MLAKCSLSCPPIVRITRLTVCTPTVRTQPTKIMPKCRKLGPEKQQPKYALAIPNAPGRFLLLMASPLGLFPKTHLGGTPSFFNNLFQPCTCPYAFGIDKAYFG